jgi:predicted transcriptional regulator
MNEILKSLKKRRLELKLKQSEFGNKLGLPQSHISKIEQGATDPRLSTVTDMARILDQELVLVPREMLPVIKSILSSEDSQKPMWSLDEEDEQ